MTLEEAKQKIIDKVFSLKEGWRRVSEEHTINGINDTVENDSLPGVFLWLYSTESVQIRLKTRGRSTCTIYHSKEPDRVQFALDIVCMLNNPETALDKKWVIELAESL